VKFLVIVNASPWGSSLATTALRFVRAALESGHEVPMVFFRDDGIYNAMPGAMADDGLPAPQEQWRVVAREHAVDLALCSAAAARRLPEATAARLPEPFRVTGLAEMVGVLGSASRVVSF
jgi:tRNA 2-thiouridine synthesizing protein D